MLDSIITEGTSYNFVYDVFGNTDSISVGNRELANYEYNSYNGKLHTINYGNGFSVRYVYDKLDNIKEVWYNNGGSETKVYVAVVVGETALMATATTTAICVATTAAKVAVVATAAAVAAKTDEDTVEQVKQQVSSTKSMSHTVYALVDSEGTVHILGEQ